MLESSKVPANDPRAYTRAIAHTHAHTCTRGKTRNHWNRREIITMSVSCRFRHGSAMVPLGTAFPAPFGPRDWPAMILDCQRAGVKQDERARRDRGARHTHCTSPAGRGERSKERPRTASPAAPLRPHVGAWSTCPGHALHRSATGPKGAASERLRTAPASPPLQSRAGPRSADESNLARVKEVLDTIFSSAL